MLSWNEAKLDMVVYIRDPIQFVDANGIDQVTAPMQRAIIGDFLFDEIVVYVDGGPFDAEDFYFDTTELQPDELLTTKEYRLYKMSEQKFWDGMKKHIKEIDAIPEKSDDLLQLRALIVKHNAKM